MEKLRRLIERPFGELLFASAVIMGDGATERALIPPLLRHALGGRAHGVCVVDPGSMASDLAAQVVKFAELVGIPWFLFSDSDKSGRKAAEALIATHGEGDRSKLIWVPGEAAADTKGAATEQMLVEFDSQLCERACVKLGFEPGQDVLGFMTGRKGVIGSFLAKELVEIGPWPSETAAQQTFWPAPICDLISKVDKALSKLAAISR